MVFYMREIKKKFARHLRKTQTKAEMVAWSHLKDRRFSGYKFRRQHVIEGFVVDFYCRELALAIELDGPIHERRKEYDKIREEILFSEGLRVIRFKNREVCRKRLDFHNKLKECIAQLP